MENVVKQRIIEVLRSKGVTINALAKGNSALQRKLNRQINENASITIQTIMSILNEYNDVSAEWLLRGEGNMLRVNGYKLPDVKDPATDIGIGYFNSLMAEIEQLKNKVNQIENERRAG